MAYRLRRGPCEDCHEPVARRLRTSAPLLCLDCSLARQVRRWRELHERNGPSWDEHVAAARRAHAQGRMTDEALAGILAARPRPSK